MLFFHQLTEVWKLAACLFAFFLLVSILALTVRIPRWDRTFSAKWIWRSMIALWLVFMSVVMTLIDSPFLPVSKEAIDWMFMVSAFLGIPFSLPPLVLAVWAFACELFKAPLRLSDAVLIALGALGLGCAVSNVHDIAWCGIITHGYTVHYKAGYDLALFIAAGVPFGYSEELMADYATLGPCAAVMVLGELLVAWASFFRMRKLHR